MESWTHSNTEFAMWTSENKKDCYKGIKKLLQGGALECNHVAVQNACAYNFFFFLNQYILKIGKLFVSNDYLNKSDFSVQFFLLGFSIICLQDHTESKCYLGY